MFAVGGRLFGAWERGRAAGIAGALARASKGANSLPYPSQLTPVGIRPSEHRQASDPVLPRQTKAPVPAALGLGASPNPPGLAGLPWPWCCRPGRSQGFEL